MNDVSFAASGSMFECDDSIWWITGGFDEGFSDLDSNDVFSVNGNSFSYGVKLPKEMAVHNLINVNNTHMVVLGGYSSSADEVYIIDR